MSQKQKPNLAAALAESGGSTRRKPVATLPTSSLATPRKSEDAAPKNSGDEAKEVYQQPSRVDTAPITAHFPRQVRDQLKILAIEQGSTLHKLVAEAYNDLFAKYGKPEIAPHQSMTVVK
jgi:hypothetical protein